MSTRLISYQQVVTEADPAFYRDRLRPWIYQFSNGRLFYQIPDPYAGPWDLGDAVLDSVPIAVLDSNLQDVLDST